MNSILEKIHKSAIKFLTPLTLDETYQIIVKEGVKLVGGDDAVLLLKEGRKLTNAFASSKKVSESRPRKNGYTYTAMRQKKAIVVQSNILNKIHPEVKEQGIKSAVFIPIYYKNKSIGALVIRSFRRKSFTGEELRALKIFGSMASMGIRNVQLLNETKDALKMRDLFMSAASHEFKTPLTAINGYVQLLQRKLMTNNSEYKWVESLSKETKRLIKMVDELLEINQIRTGTFKYDKQEVSVKDIATQAIETVQIGHPDKVIIFEDNIKGISDKIHGDQLKLVQVITNILNNAAKFSKPHSQIILTIDNQQPFISIKVKDQGMGISKEEMSRIFERFYKGAHRMKEGMGLGLYLSKLIVDEHQGDIVVKSEINKGTSVEIRLPQTKT